MASDFRSSAWGVVSSSESCGVGWSHADGAEFHRHFFINAITRFAAQDGSL